MTKVGIIGVSGYTGLELIKLLLDHPYFEITYVAGTKGGVCLSELHPALEGIELIKVKEANVSEVAKRCELVFLALPHQASMQYARALLEVGVKVVDLSADYRLEQEVYERHYCKHEDPVHLSEATYGLIEYNRQEIKRSRLVASPGCYPTATLLGILPFVEYIDFSKPLIVDAKSGVSGAGKKLSEATAFVSINENMHAYNPLKHRHAPEIKEKIAQFGGKSAEVVFVPHLIPITRGEMVSVYVLLKEEIDAQDILQERYGDEPFIRLRNKPTDVKSVAGTHFCDIFVSMQGDTLFVSIAIDNLLRGAASQAIAAANLMCGYDEHLSLPIIPYVP